MNNKIISGRQFMRAFYDLFTNWQDEFFAGTREQARLLMQLNLNRFIPKSYIEKAFKIFREAKLIKNTGQNIKIDMRIGEIYFKPRAVSLYKRLINDEETLNVYFSKLELAFDDFMEKSDELINKKDIELVNKIQKEKEKELLNVMGKSEYKEIKNKYFDDKYLKYDLLIYDVPRIEVLNYIEKIKEYDAKQIKIHEELLKQETMLKHKKKEAQNEEIETLWNKVYNKVSEIIQKSIDLNGYKEVILKKRDPYGMYCSKTSLKFGIIVPKLIEWEDLTIKIKADNFIFIVKFNGVEIDKDNNQLEIIDDNFSVSFEIDNNLVDEIEIIEFYLNKIGTLESMRINGYF